jgi:hypothetical protein
MYLLPEVVTKITQGYRNNTKLKHKISISARKTKERAHTGKKERAQLADEIP